MINHNAQGILCLAFGLFVAVFCQTAWGRDLLENGSFEADGAEIVASTGWDNSGSTSNSIGFASVRWPYFENGEFVAGNVVWELPPGELPDDFTGFLRPVGVGEVFGKSWGAANGDGHFGSATQIVDLTDVAGKPYEFSAWLASADRDQDHAVVTLEFFAEPGATGSSVGSLSFDGNDQTSAFIVGSLNLEGFADATIAATQDNWTLYQAAGTLPPDAQSASVVIRSVDVPGTNNGEDAYVDLVSLRVVPEPSSVVLVLVVAFPLFIWLRQGFGVRTAPSSRTYQ